MLHALNEEALSAAELADRLQIAAVEASYHLNMLLKTRSIEPADDDVGRPELDRRFRAMARAELDDDAWARLTLQERNGVSRAILDNVLGHAYESVAQGTFNGRDDAFLTVTDVNLDERGWAELSALAHGLLERVFELEAQSAARAASGSANDIRTRIVAMQYEGAPSRRSTPPSSAPDGQAAPGSPEPRRAP
ncbi:MAG: hypothetical protein ACJ762_06410 [Solirubrobacteraceae bacterium]